MGLPAAKRYASAKGIVLAPAMIGGLLVEATTAPRIEQRPVELLLNCSPIRRFAHQPNQNATLAVKDRYHGSAD